MLIWAVRTVYFFSTITVVSCGWPKGTYGLPKPKSGCPSNPYSAVWMSGRRVQETEPGSVASENNQLAGADSTSQSYVVQEFCMKTESNVDDDASYFMPGHYCIFKKNRCPFGFSEGWIYWDDGAPHRGATKQTYSGSLPDGLFDRNTRIFYCCRNDGPASEPIELPYKEPFFLMKRGRFCQQVANMDVEEQWQIWYDEETFNRDSSDGQYPEMVREKTLLKATTKLFYCYYKPRAGVNLTESGLSSLRLHTVIVAGYVIGATVGFVLVISIVLTAVQRALLLRQIRAARDCRSNGDERACADDACPASANATNDADDHPPPYEVAVMDSPIVSAASVSVRSDCAMTVPLIPAGTAKNEAALCLPSYTEFLEGSSSVKPE